MDRVREIMTNLKNSIDEAEDRNIESFQYKREASDMLEKYEEDGESHRRRFKLLENDLEKARKALEEKEERLEHLENCCTDDDEKRKEYESLEIERDEELTIVEDECVKAKEQATEALHVLAEASRKLQVLEADVEKVNKRLEDSENHERSCIEVIERNGRELRDLEGRDDEAATREMEAEEKLRFLEEQLKEEVSRGENAERDVIRNETIVANIQNELNKVKEAHGKLGEEVENIDKFADDICQGKIEFSEEKPEQPAEPSDENAEQEEQED